MFDQLPHHFHIPVMGLSYTIDSPIKVARFGISSVISIVEDHLIEIMRSHYYPVNGQTYRPIDSKEEDFRARRITDYLDLVSNIVGEQFENLKNSAFEAGSEIVKYFEMLPDDGKLKQLYLRMMSTQDPSEKSRWEARLRKLIVPGSIDVNIMTKVDRDAIQEDGSIVENGSDAVSALRGYVNSCLEHSAVVFSAGMNPRLYNYLEDCRAFDPDKNGRFRKKVIVKVSDYRSALIQGKYLAKKGIWVSEFRVESGLNCGGHAFATEGHLLGPVLEEFKNRRTELVEALFEIYKPALLNKGIPVLRQAPPIGISAQGGIGTHEEDVFLRRHYDLSGTGWGTPFLLVPEATTVDNDTLQQLCDATAKDLELSHNSPLGVRFHYLKGGSAEQLKHKRIREGRPGSPCVEKLLAFNTEFTKEPICTASRTYQKLKAEQLKALQLPVKEYQEQLQSVLDKECLCVGLSNSAAIRYQKVFVKGRREVNICPGPNIVHFSKVVSLQTMVDHIYGRTDILSNPDRPHMFIAELDLYVNYLKGELKKDRASGQLEKKERYYNSFFQNLRNGIDYYRRLPGVAQSDHPRFEEDLDRVEWKLGNEELRLKGKAEG
ncbi:MAG TPA: hypothetical protein VFX48_05835 [Saprospiraceae bacterium]|nr:hypothetical protein [Saprospiraceae bacterium]